MKFLIVDSYYQGFLSAWYRSHPGLARRPYSEQWRLLMDQCFGTSDFYSRNLRDLGHEAQEVVPNCYPLQRRWALERAPSLWATYPVYEWLNKNKHWQVAVVKAQIESFNPDIVYVQDMNWMEDEFLRGIKRKGRLIVGQTAYALREDIDFTVYDLVVTSFPHYVDMFRKQGVQSELLRFAFEPRVLKLLGRTELRHPATFVGSYTERHAGGTRLLEHVTRQVPVEFWGYGSERLSDQSPILRSFHGEAWGLDMYRALAESKIALNRHIDVSHLWANNMRLYEATGVGALLVTDAKENLHELFEVGTEVLAYRSQEECAELVGYYLRHEHERHAIALAGQTRVLKDHTYYHRMQELTALLQKYV
jgi:spore maturation protein CgeB